MLSLTFLLSWREWGGAESSAWLGGGVGYSPVRHPLPDSVSSGSCSTLSTFNSIQFYLYSAKLQQLSSQGTLCIDVHVCLCTWALMHMFSHLAIWRCHGTGHYWRRGLRMTCDGQCLAFGSPFPLPYRWMSQGGSS